MKKTIALVALLALTGAGCQMATNPPSATPTVTSTSSADAQKTPLEGVWKMSKYQKNNDTVQSVTTNEWYLTFKGRHMDFKVCNSGGGDFTLTGDRLKGDGLVSTLMYCEGMPSEVESALMGDLNIGITSRVDGDMLLLTGTSSTKQTYTLERVKNK